MESRPDRNRTVIDEPGIGNGLSFEIADLDRTDTPAIVQSLSEIEAAFPLVGVRRRRLTDN
jgi:hypothetical protein